MNKLLIGLVLACVMATGCGKTAEIDKNHNEAADSIDVTAAYTNGDSADTTDDKPVEKEKTKPVIVIDPGHGAVSSALSDEEKRAAGYEYNSEKKSWGEWRHYKNDTFGEDCHGDGCTLTAPSGGSCWYPMTNADRETEPEINLNNALAAKKYLEEMGCEVRMTHTTNDTTPSMNKRVTYCFKDGDINTEPDADLYICLHSNTGGGRGTSYIALEDEYRQKYIKSDYIEKSNRAGEIINEKVAAATGLTKQPPIGNEGWLILFNKCPVPIAYMEIGFFDNSADLEILKSKSDAIGKAVAEGAMEYLSEME